MSEEGPAKLRLKPRKAPPPRGRESPPRRQTLTDGCSWFEKGDLNDSEKTWILLLKDISQDLQCTNWQTVPSFPEFFRKSSEEENLQKQELFTVGTKDFQWVSFPPFCKENHLNPEDLTSIQLTQSQIHPLHNSGGQADELESLPSTAEKTCCVTMTDQAKNMIGEDTKGISKLDTSPKSYELTQHRSSTHCLVLPQSSAKAFSFQQHCRGTVGNGRENRKGNDRKELQIQRHQGNISFGEARHVPAEKLQPPVTIPGAESCKEMTENQNAGSSTLDSCPMCLLQFSGTQWGGSRHSRRNSPPKKRRQSRHEKASFHCQKSHFLYPPTGCRIRLSQLDIDGHLARCLSESADDVTW